jgi:hypothetical protein
MGQAMALRPDGRIWIGGELFDGTTKRAFVARVTGAGALDTTFNLTGYGTTATGNANGIRALALQSDGKLVCGGDVFESPTGNDFAVFRLP